MRPRCRELGVRLGILEPGARNTIAVPGRGPVRTGVTVIVPHPGNVWRDRPKAMWDTINGCGELTGAVEMREFGVLETPIGLTNTMCVGNVAIGLIEWTLAMNPDAAIGESTVVATGPGGGAPGPERPP